MLIASDVSLCENRAPIIAFSAQKRGAEANIVREMSKNLVGIFICLFFYTKG